ncbi:GTP-binding protein [Paenibacillus anaericanus]|uniref:GTP-binding protein n=1 Tax=Paenibacillus anaericanus TaxID=170367 RepID=A0A3S1BEF5_9BACL|nr:GTP-binding protein [Paenibacillus anaericanus]RUT39730.1 GTP-binding protein [Paenibacillus anaericanus]
MERVTPVYILSGFLGSGKTTLLQRLLSYWKDNGLRPAVIMNELGDINLDGLLVTEEVPMAEMLDGCICCTVRGDLGLQMSELVTQEQPDLVIIEATGAANPMEIFDAVTEVSLYLKLEIKPMITVVDSAYLAELYESQKGKTYRLMLDQIRCGSVLILNKVDRISEEKREEIRELLIKLNPYAEIVDAVKCDVDLGVLLRDKLKQHSNGGVSSVKEEYNLEDDHEKCDENCKHEHGEGNEHHEHDKDHHNHPHTHVSHNHVTVYSHYFNGPVDSVEFERFIAELPREVYRGKGVLSFSDTASRFLFQYAYREADYLKIAPQGDVPDVAVFIGEHFDQTLLAQRLSDLENKQSKA